VLKSILYRECAIVNPAYDDMHTVLQWFLLVYRMTVQTCMYSNT